MYFILTSEMPPYSLKRLSCSLLSRFVLFAAPELCAGRHYDKQVVLNAPPLGFLYFFFFLFKKALLGSPDGPQTQMGHPNSALQSSWFLYCENFGCLSFCFRFQSTRFLRLWFRFVFETRSLVAPIGFKD